jgi:hypothetical protein
MVDELAKKFETLHKSYEANKQANDDDEQKLHVSIYFSFKKS